MKLVVEEKIKTINKADDENILFTNEKVINTDSIITKELIIPAVNMTATIEKETFLSQVDNQDGNYVFWNSENQWHLDDVDVDIADYGITLSGESEEGDEISVVVQNGDIIEQKYAKRHDIMNVECSFFDLTSEVSNKIEIFVGEGSMTLNTDKLQLKTLKKEAIMIALWTQSTKEFKIKLVVSK